MKLLVQELRCGGAEVNENRRREEKGDERLVAVVMPPPRGGERQERNRKQQRHEGQRGDERKLGAVHTVASCCY